MSLLYRWGITNLLRRGDNPLLSDTLRERRLEQIRCTNISNGIQIPLRQKKMPSGRSRVLSGWRFLFSFHRKLRPMKQKMLRKGAKRQWRLLCTDRSGTKRGL